MNLLPSLSLRRSWLAAGLLVGVLALAALACGPPGLQTVPATAVPATIAPPTRLPTGGGAAKGGGAAGGASTGQITNYALTVANYTGLDICYVYISPTSSDTWGTDWLDPSATIPAGTETTFRVDGGQYDLLATDCGGAEIATLYGQSLATDLRWEVSTGGGAAPVPAGGSAGGTISGGGNTGGATGNNTGIDYTTAVVVWNNSGADICYVYISPSTATTWGSDWLGSDIIAAGSSYIFYIPGGTWDMLATDCADNVLGEQYSVLAQGLDQDWTIGGGGQAPPAGGQTSGTVTVTIVNQTSEDVCYLLYGEPYSEWIGDAFVQNWLDPWGTITVTLPAGYVALQAQDCSGMVMKTETEFYATDGAVWYVDP